LPHTRSTWRPGAKRSLSEFSRKETAVLSEFSAGPPKRPCGAAPLGFRGPRGPRRSCVWAGCRRPPPSIPRIGGRVRKFFSAAQSSPMLLGQQSHERKTFLFFLLFFYFCSPTRAASKSDRTTQRCLAMSEAKRAHTTQKTKKKNKHNNKKKQKKINIKKQKPRASVRTARTAAPESHL